MIEQYKEIRKSPKFGSISLDVNVGTPKPDANTYMENTQFRQMLSQFQLDE